MTSTTQVTVTIQGANDAPVAVIDTATAVEAGGVNNGTAGTNPTGNVLTNDTDVDAGDTKIVAGVAAGVVASASTNVGVSVNGTFGAINIAAGGAFAYTVDNNNATVQALRTAANTLTDVFTYTMRDTAGLTSTTQVTVTIQGADDAPLAVNDIYSTAEDTPLVISVAIGVKANDSDIDDPIASVSAIKVTNPTQGTVTLAADGSFTYTPNLNANGQDTFTYKLNDGTLETCL